MNPIDPKSMAENASQESEAYNRSIVESSRDCTTVMDLEGGLILLPGRSREMLHLPADLDFRGQSWLTLWDPDDRPAAQQALTTAVNGGTASFIGLMPMADGESIWWDVLATPVLDDARKIHRVLAVARDVTARRRAETNAVCLASISKDILLLTRGSEIVEAVGQRLGAHLNLDRCELLEINLTGGSIQSIYQWSSDSSVVDAADEIEWTEDLLHDLRAGEIVSLAHTRTHLLISATPPSGPSDRAVLAVPVQRPGTRFHSLCVQRSSGHVWRSDEIELVDEIAARLVAHLERVRSEEISSRLAAIVEHSGDAIVSKDLNSIITSWNKGAESLFGYTAEEMIGKSITLLIPPELEHEEETVLQTVKSGESILNQETVRLTKDGRLVEISLTVSPVINPRGEIIGASKFARDISQRKHAEQELIESEERFRVMVNAIIQLAWMAEPDGYIFWYNQSWYDYTGTTPEAMQGWGWQSVHDPAELPRVLEGWRKSIELGKAFEMTFPLRGADGHYRQFLTRSIPLKDSAGKVVRWFGTNTDIDEITRAEKALRESHQRTTLAHRATGVGIWEWHIPSGRIHWDAEMFHIYGVPPTADGWVSYDTWKNAVLPEDLPHQEAAQRDGLAGNNHGKRQFRIRRHGDDEIRHIETVDVVRLNDDGKPESIVGTNLDITTRKQVEKKLMERTAQLVRADRSKDEFLAMLAHELRNPLAPMRNATEILRNDDAPAQDRRHAQELIARQIGNLSRMIDDLLDVSRITEGKIVLHRETVCLREIITAAANAIRADCVAHHQELVISLPDTPLFVDADSTRLEQVLGNLLGNACKYSGAGTRISLSAKVETQNKVTICVADNGTGISPELLPHVFELFVQSSRTLDRSHGGLGIGLTVVQRLVNLHGGSIVATSGGEGKGTEFIIRLPLVSPPTTAKIENVPSEKSHSLRILIVDDNVDAAETMAMLQQLRGHQTRIAHNGQHALETASNFLPHAILLDIGLPGMDGYEIASRIRQLPALENTFLIALTGYGSEKDRELGRAAGFNEHLTKPADLEQLRRWLDALLRDP
ncbi:MAG: PAS domain S-box protein [Verrucomicrobiota bacterium]